MLNIDNLSFWERKTYFEEIDFLIVGAGIVGFSTALELRKKHPKAKILVVERGYLPSGASSKNAGFACFGSVTELLDDLSHIPEEQVWSTVEMRWQGLQNLRKLIGDKNLDLQMNGSWDLLLPSEQHKIEEIDDKLSYLNQQIEQITNEKLVYAKDDHSAQQFGFKNIATTYSNRLEGQIDTGKMIIKFHQLATENSILSLYGIEILALQSNLYNVSIQSNIGYFKAKNVLITTNGFARQFLPNRDIDPARAQVLVTSPIEDLKVKGTFHYQQGYYYFRNVGDRILLGGGRNIDFEKEKTTELAVTEEITIALHSLLRDVILPETEFNIEYHWAGIMGVGKTKAPIIEPLGSNIAVGVRLGGMGVAIGSLVGKKLAELF